MRFADVEPAVRGWLILQRARLARKRHPDMGEISAFCFYATKLRFGDLVFDIGANHGTHTQQMLKRGARVVAVEPQSAVAGELAKRFPTVTVVQKAVGDAPGEAVLHLAPELDTLASLREEWIAETGIPVAWQGSEDVQVTTLDDLIDEFGKPTLVKIDTEGSDHRVLRGLSQPIDHLLFEIFPDADAPEAFSALDDLGSYEYRAAAQVGGESWAFGAPERPDEILSRSDVRHNVYARRIQ